MRLVNNIETLADVYSEEEAIRILARAGFDAIDWSFFGMVEDACP